MPIKTEKIELSNEKDFRDFGHQLNVAMKKVIEMDFGIYKIESKHRHLFLVLENMVEFQEQNNRGIRVMGDFSTKKIEIYDYRKDQQQMDDMVLDLDL